MTDDTLSPEERACIEELERAAHPRKPRRERKPGSETLAAAALHAAMTPKQRRLVRTAKALCLVVQVPSADWVRPVRNALREMGPWDTCNEGEANAKTRAKDGSIIAAEISAGRRVVGVSDAPDALLPIALVSAADLRLVLPRPNASVISDVVAKATFRRPVDVPAGIAGTLGYSEIGAAIRVGSTPAQCIERLSMAALARTAASMVGDVPLLRELAGYGAAMDWCTELCADVDAWRRGEAPFPSQPRVVFAGPPGTGKTTLVKSLARSMGFSLVATSVGDWFANSTGHLDGVIKQITEVFAQAQASSPAILFLDELDAVPNRATMSSRGRDWWLPVVTYLLTTLDGAVSKAAQNLVIVGATNHADHLDAALVRPGRLERVIHIETPDDADTRVGILRTHLKGDLAGDDLSLVGRLTPRATGADLAGLVRRARRDARAAGRPLALADFMSLVMPQERRDRRTLHRVAVHEAGHAVASAALGLAVLGVSIVETEASGGYIESDPAMAGMPVREDIERYVTVSLAGAAAEEVLLGARSAGAGGSHRSDLAKTTEVLAMMRASFGLCDDLAFRAPPEGALRLIDFDAAFRDEVEDDLRRLYARARTIMEGNVDKVRAIAAALEAKRFLDGPTVAATLQAASHKDLNVSLTPNLGPAFDGGERSNARQRIQLG